MFIFYDVLRHLAPVCLPRSFVLCTPYTGIKQALISRLFLFPRVCEMKWMHVFTDGREPKFCDQLAQDRRAIYAPAGRSY